MFHTNIPVLNQKNCKISMVVQSAECANIRTIKQYDAAALIIVI